MWSSFRKPLSIHTAHSPCLNDTSQVPVLVSVQAFANILSLGIQQLGILQYWREMLGKAFSLLTRISFRRLKRFYLAKPPPSRTYPKPCQLFYVPNCGWRISSHGPNLVFRHGADHRAPSSTSHASPAIPGQLGRTLALGRGESVLGANPAQGRVYPGRSGARRTRHPACMQAHAAGQIVPRILQRVIMVPIPS